MLPKPGWLQKIDVIQSAFAGTNVKLTSEGWPYLGSAIGSTQFIC